MGNTKGTGKEMGAATLRSADASRLKRAGWKYGNFACFIGEKREMGWWHPKHPDRHTKAQALTLLSAAGPRKARKKKPTVESPDQIGGVK